MSAHPLVAIGDVVEAVHTWNPITQAPDATFTYVDLSSVDQDAKVITAERMIRCGEAPSRARQIVNTGDVLVSTVRPNLNAVAFVPDHLDGATASTGFTVLRPEPRTLDGRYLFHWVKTPDFIDAMVRRATGASYPAVSDRIIAESKLPLPSLAEQRRIAEILDRTDALRAKRRAALARIDTLTQSIFFDMFGDPRTNPHEWREFRLGDFVVIGPQNGLYKPSHAYGSGTLILRIDGFYDGELSDRPMKRVQVSDAERARYGLRPFDIVVNRVNSREYLGKSALIRDLDEPTVFESNMMRFAVDHRVIDPEYLISVLQTQHVRNQVLGRAKDAVNQSSINQDDVAAITISVPPLALQKSFVQRKLAVAVCAAANERSLSNFDGIFASLQHRAFRGEL